MKVRALLLLILGVAGLPAVAQSATGARHLVLPVTFEFQSLLLSREAPQSLTLLTPWGKASGRLRGEAHPDPDRADAFGAVRPLLLRVAVPTGTRPGTYAARLTGELYTCDKERQVCTRHALDLPVKLQVLASGAVRPPAPLRLNDAALNPPWRWLF